MNYETLLTFCGTETDPREYIRAPWHMDGKTYATNGHILVEIEGTAYAAGPASPFIPADRTRRMLAELPKTGYEPLIFNSTFELLDCPHCEGSGNIRECPSCNGDGAFKHFGDDYECKKCDGTGERPAKHSDINLPRCPACQGSGKNRESKTIQVGNARFQAHYLQMIANLPGQKFSPAGRNDPAGFIFNGGRGALMPRKW
ncbi:hypothetical protein [Chromobacterium amazonense]|uniref:hypothetical protein n=1 Tax=Chromobacterium amazonense TaxID=1382803 RepID=UPI003F794C8D